jgi:hypothetical protein
MMRIKLLKFHCTHAGFIRAGALYGRRFDPPQLIKAVETRDTAQPIGLHYREWVAIASTRLPKNPNWELVHHVAECAARVHNNPEWLQILEQPELYTASCILAIAKVADVYEMQVENFPESELERMVGGWEVGRWAALLEKAIAPEKPIPYDIPVQGSVFLAEKHGSVYEQVRALVEGSQIQ